MSRTAEQQVTNVRIVELTSDIKQLIEKLDTLLDNFNKFFEMAFTNAGRLKVAAIPVAIGVTEEAMQKIVEGLGEMPDLTRELINEIKGLRETLEKSLKVPPSH